MIKLELTIDEVNGILASLGKMPFEAVAGLVDKIKQQGIPQVQALEAAKAAETPSEE